MKKIFNKSIISVATITTVVVSLLSPMGMITLPAGAVSPEPTISIDTITDDVDTYYYPFDFSCPTHPLFSPITLTGSGVGSAPPGQIQQYHVQIVWGDGEETNDLGVFTPPSGQGPFTYTFTAGPHSYESGDATITVRLYHSEPPGQDNQAYSVMSVPICVVTEPPILNVVKEVIGDYKTCILINDDVPPEPYCGDGEINGEEVCELGDTQPCTTTNGYAGSQACNQDCLDWGECVPTESCGDGVINGPEVCEVGDTQPCQTQEGYSGTQYCLGDCSGWDECESEEFCGDGIINDAEQCDDGEQNGVPCNPSYGGSCQYCSGICALANVQGAYCGDGNVDPEEVCEVGDSQPCQTQEGYNGYQTCGQDCSGWDECISLESCGDGAINDAEECDDGQNNGVECTPVYGSSCNYCSLFCEITTTTGPYCGDGVVNGEEQCEENADCEEGMFCNGCICEEEPECELGQTQPCDTGQSGVCAAGTQTCDENGSWGECVQDEEPVTEICDDELDNDCDGYTDCDDEDCAEDENCQEGPTPECEAGATTTCSTGQLGICAAGTQTCDEEGFWGECIVDNEPATEICDDDLDNDCDGNVDCSDSDCTEDANCLIPPSGGGPGGGAPIYLTISNETNGEVLTYSVTVIWFTNVPATSRVIYDTVPHDILGSPPNYGYAFSTIEDPNKVTYHEVTITGLFSGTTYYWRAISHGSPEIWGDELSFTTLPPEEEILALGGEEEEEEILPPIGEEEELPPPVGEEEEEEVILPIGEEEEEETIAEAEEEPGLGLTNLLAAIGTFFGSANFCWLFFLLIVILTIIFLLGAIRKKAVRKNQWILPLIILILIILYCIFCCGSCWVLILTISALIILCYLFRKQLGGSVPIK